VEGKGRKGERRKGRGKEGRPCLGSKKILVTALINTLTKNNSLTI